MREQEGLTIEETAIRFGVGGASITRWLKRVEPQETRNKPATKLDMGEIEENPAAYQYELAKQFGVCQAAIGKALQRLKISYKKTLAHPKADENARHIFQDKIKAYQTDNQPIVYIDESGFAHDMQRTHGYAPSGKRCVGKHDWQAKGRTHVIGALLASCLLTATLFTGSVNANVFVRGFRKIFYPKLPPNSVIVMDNASFHKRADCQQLIEQAGASTGVPTTLLT